MDALALSILRFIFFLVGMIEKILADIVTNPDWKNTLEQRSVVAMMMFDKPEIMPEEELESVITVIKIFIIAIPVISIWNQIVKPLITGG